MVLSPPQEELVAHEATAFINHETTAFHPNGTNAAQVWRDIGAVAHALIVATLEVPFLIEDDLLKGGKCQWYKMTDGFFDV